MSQFVVEEVGHHSVKESGVSPHLKPAGARQLNPQSLFRQGRFVEVDHDTKKVIQVNGNAMELERVGFGFRNVERPVQELCEAIHVLDGRYHRFRLLVFRAGSQCHLQLGSYRCQGTAKIVSERSGDGVQLMNGALDAVQHAIQGEGQMSDLVLPSRSRNPPAQIGLTDARRGLGNLTNVTQETPGRQKDDGVADAYDQKPKKSKSKAQPSEHAQLIAFGHTQIDIAFSSRDDADHAKWGIEAGNFNVGRCVGGDPAVLNSPEMSSRVSGADP